MTNRPRAIVLLSGGLDSATTLAIAKKEGFDLYAMTFNYGQRHSQEIECAKRLAMSNSVVRHTIVNIDLREFGTSALTADLAVPKNRYADEMAECVPVTYVPARNTIFLSFALAFAEVVDAADIFAGMNALDYAGYPDCRPEYIASFEAMANLATKAAVQNGRKLRIHSPLIALSKAEIIGMGVELGVDYSFTSSCYDPSPKGEACGECDSCVLRLAGFEENDRPDPITYRVRELMVP